MGKKVRHYRLPNNMRLIMIASLIYNTPELIPILRGQVPDIYLIDVSEEPIEGCNQRYETNLMWARNWHRFLSEYKSGFVWMLNSDIYGVDSTMYHELAMCMEKDVLMITPSFNSPHEIFQPKKGESLKQVNWIDMTCPLINVELYHKLGGFDPRFVGYFADIDLCFRARQAGYKMFVDYSIEVNHIGSYTVQKTGKWEQAAVDDNQLLIEKYGKNWYELI
jgi:hypothetical protein